MNQKTLSKRISYVILALLLIEIVIFSGWYFTQPTYKTKVLSIVKDHENQDQNAFFQSLTNTTPSVQSTYHALSIYSSLNESVNNKENIASYILSNYNSSTGLFDNNNASSLETTFQAVSSLNLLGKASVLNKTMIIKGVLGLQTNDSLFREFNEINTSHQIVIGELDHLYQALSILHILYQNDTLLHSTLNITRITQTIVSLQGGDGGMYEGILYSSANMRNAYYTGKIFQLINKPMSYYESLGFRTSDLEQWLSSMYSNKGFKIQGDSEPSVEATAYAFITYRNLNKSIEYIKSNFPDGVNSIINFLDSDFTKDNSRNPLDVLHDVIAGLTQIGQQSQLNKPYFNETAQFYFASSFAIIIFAFVVNTLINLAFALKEDDTKYFEGKLHLVIQKLLENNSGDLSDLKTLLGEPISSIELVPLEYEEKLAIMKAYSPEYYFLITYETFNGLAKKIEKYTNDDELIAVIDFLESDIFFTVEEGTEHLKNNIVTE